MGCDVRNLHGEPSKSRAIFGCYGLWDLVCWRLVESNIYRKQDVFGLLKPWLHHPCLENVSNVISNMRLVSRLAPECSRHPIPISSGSDWSPFRQPAPVSFDLHIYCVMQLLLMMVLPWTNQHLGFFSYGVVPHGFITLDLWCVCHTFCIMYLCLIVWPTNIIQGYHVVATLKSMNIHDIPWWFPVFLVSTDPVIDITYCQE